MVRVMAEPGDAVSNVVYGNDTRARVGEFVHAPRPPFRPYQDGCSKPE